MSRYEIGPKEMKELDMHLRISLLEESIKVLANAVDVLRYQIVGIQKCLDLGKDIKINPDNAD